MSKILFGYTWKYHSDSNLNIMNLREEEALFLNPDGVRTRFPIGWNGPGRYIPGSLIVTNLITGEVMDIEEEDNGVFYNFKTAPEPGSYSDYKVMYIPRLEDLAISYGIVNKNYPVPYPGERYFLFPNWLGAKGCGDAFWVSCSEMTRMDATNAAEGSRYIYQSKENCRIPTNIFDPAIDGWIQFKRGEQFHRIRNREWANIALWCNAVGIDPRGNTYSKMKKTWTNADGFGTTPSGGKDTTNYVLPSGNFGSVASNGATTWSHNGYNWGIAGLVGNTWCWVDGIKIINNRIFVFNDDNTDYVDSGVDIEGNLVTDPPIQPSSGDPVADAYGYDGIYTELDILKHECIPCNHTDGKSIELHTERPNVYWPPGANRTDEEILVVRGADSREQDMGNLWSMWAYFTFDNIPAADKPFISTRLVKDLDV